MRGRSSWQSARPAAPPACCCTVGAADCRYGSGAWRRPRARGPSRAARVAAPAGRRPRLTPGPVACHRTRKPTTASPGPALGTWRCGHRAFADDNCIAALQRELAYREQAIGIRQIEGEDNALLWRTRTVGPHGVGAVVAQEEDRRRVGAQPVHAAGQRHRLQRGDPLGREANPRVSAAGAKGHEQRLSASTNSLSPPRRVVSCEGLLITLSNMPGI